MAANPIPPAPSLSFETRSSGDTVTVLCHGKLVSETSSALKEEVRPLIGKFKMIVLDLTDLKYVDSSGLGTLVGLLVSAKRGSSHLKLINLGERIQELLRLTHLSGVFQEYGEYL